MEKQKLIVCDFLPDDENEIRSVFPFAFFDTCFCASLEDVKAELEKEFDKILIVSAPDTELLLQELLAWNPLCEDKLIHVQSYCKGDMQFPFCRFRFGQMHRERTFYVMVPEPDNGLFYFMNYVIRQMAHVQSEGFTPFVDMQYHRSLYLKDEEVGSCNAWEYYFENLSDFPLSEIYQSADVIIASNDMNSFPNAGFRNTQRASLYSKFIHEKTELLERLEQQKQHVFGEKERVLGVICRGTDYANAFRPYAHPIPLDAFELCEIASQYMTAHQYEYIYLATEDHDVLDVFRTRFGSKVLSCQQQRFSDKGSRKLAELVRDVRDNNEADARQLGEEYYFSIALLACCDSIIGTHCAGMRAAITLNGCRYRLVRVFHKGKYGLNDASSLIAESVNRNLLCFADPDFKTHQDGIMVQTCTDGRVHFEGTAQNTVRLKLVQSMTYLPAGTYHYRVALPDGLLINVHMVDDQGNLVILSGKNRSGVMILHRPIVRYSVKAAVVEGTTLDYDASLMFEKGQQSIGCYCKSHTSITEIGLKDEAGSFLMPSDQDVIDITNGTVCINGEMHPLSKEELEKYHTMVRYPNGLVRFRYRNKYIGVEQVCVHF